MIENDLIIILQEIKDRNFFKEKSSKKLQKVKGGGK